MIKKLLVGLIALTFGSLAFASGDTFVQPPAAKAAFAPGIYVGAQAGYGMTGWNNVDQTNYSFMNTDTNTSITGSNAFAGRIFVGYDFHPNFAIEAGYTQFFNNTKITTTTNVNIPATFVMPIGGSVTAVSNPKYDYAVDLVGKIKAHLIDNFGLYAKAGVDYIHVQADYSLQSGGVTLDSGTSKDSEFNVIYGVGAYYDITPNLTADVSWTRYTGDTKLNSFIPVHDLFAAGASWKFNLA